MKTEELLKRLRKDGHKIMIRRSPSIYPCLDFLMDYIQEEEKDDNEKKESRSS